MSSILRFLFLLCYRMVLVVFSVELELVKLIWLVMNCLMFVFELVGL